MVLLVVLAALINAVIIGFIARRLLGVPVGWPRTIAVSLVVNGITAPVIESVTGGLGAPTPDGSGPFAVATTAIVLLVGAWMFALAVAALAALEAIVPTGSLPSPLELVRSLPARIRRTRRYAAILRIAARHGLGGYLRPAAAHPHEAERPERIARALKEALTDGGVTFVKLGQMISTRPDLVGPAYIRELSELHSTVPPEPWDEMRPVIEAELGRPLDEVFDRIEPDAMAAASIAQIHRARLTDGREVVVKVQRPRARRQVRADLDIVTRLAARLDRTTAWGRDLGVLDLAQGFAAALEEELDYRVELANMNAVAAGSPDVRVPATYPELSSRMLLVMDLVPGQPLSSAAATIAALPEEVRRERGESLLRTVLRQITLSGVFHADLHPGNILITESGELSLLDFGSVGRLDRESRESLASLLVAVDSEDAATATTALLDLLDAPVDLDERRLHRDIGQIIVRHRGGFGSGGTAQLVTDLFATLTRHRLSVPPQVAAAFRGMGAVEGSIQLLSPDLDLVTSSRRLGPELVRERFTPEALRDRALTQLAANLPLLQRIPRRLDRLTATLESGDFSVDVRTSLNPEDRSLVTSGLQQIAVVLLAAALGIAGAILLVSDHGLRITPELSLFTFLGFVLLLLAFVLGARALVIAFRQQRGPVARVRGR